MTVVPPSNLPPSSQPWARDVARSLDATRFDADRANVNNANAFKAINSSLKQLSEQLVISQEQQALLETQQETLENQQAYLSSLISRNDATGTLLRSTSSGDLINDDTWHFIAGTSITIPVSTGKFRVSLSTDNASVAARAPGAAYVYCGITYGYTGPATLNPDSNNTAYYRANDLTNTNINGPLTRFGTAVDTPGTYTITAYYAYRYAGTSTGYREARWTDLRLAVDVLGND